MEKKEMYALTYCYEGCYDNTPFGSTIAVSEDRNKLISKMKEMVAIDCREPDDDEDEEYSDECNWKIISDYNDFIILQHKANTDLYAKYSVNYVEIL